ncbi:hypothetical protein ACP70R_035042 [Stipagrostis hirtigluma subsp. patula]
MPGLLTILIAYKLIVHFLLQPISHKKPKPLSCSLCHPKFLQLASIAMAASRAAIAFISLLLLASSWSVVHARMMPSDHPQVQAEETGAATLSSFSRGSLQPVFMAPPTPPSLTGKPEMAAAEPRRLQVQVQGSVPSPGVGHH